MVQSLHRNSYKYLNNPIGKSFPLPPKEGLNGVEIEVEGINLPIAVGDQWNAINDGSLRGESKEYVFREPLPEDQVEAALESLNKAFLAANSVIKESYRTSVHVHVNVQKLTFKQLYNFILLYICFEDILIQLCGKERDGNLFCLRVTDAEQLVESLKSLPLYGSPESFRGDGLRYASINVNSVGKYGSLEFRAYRGTTKTEEILLWVKLLNRLRDAAMKFDNPQDIISNFSKLGYQQFTAQVFGDNPITKFILGAKQVESRLLFGVRYAQEIAFCVKDWDTTNKRNAKEQEQLYAAMKQMAEGQPKLKRVNHFNRAAGEQPMWAIMPDPFAPEPAQVQPNDQGEW